MSRSNKDVLTLARGARRAGWTVVQTRKHLRWYDPQGTLKHSSGLTTVLSPQLLADLRRAGVPGTQR